MASSASCQASFHLLFLVVGEFLRRKYCSCYRKGSKPKVMSILLVARQEVAELEFKPGYVKSAALYYFSQHVQCLP
jgi:hypothetical protein